MSGESRFSAYDRIAGRGAPRSTVLFALERFAAEGRAPGLAIDLGCGIGRDALALLERGWRVLGLDQRVEALATLAERAGLHGSRLLLWAQKIEEARLPAADFVIASFSLFLVPPERFPSVWTEIRRALRPGGRLALQLLGPRDDWAPAAGITVHRAEEVDALVTGLEVEWRQEEESCAVTPRGIGKRWHLWHLVARRPEPSAAFRSE